LYKIVEWKFEQLDIEQ